MNNDTIFALSSGHGKSGVAVIRISGNDLYETFSNFINKSEFTNRHAYFCNLRDLLMALEALGYRRLDIIEMAQKLVNQNPTADVSKLVPMALKEISSGK